jgi:hypothetical protein
MSVNNNLQTGPGRIRIATFTASGSWTAPAGVYAVNVLAVGGGGGGGGAGSNGSTTQATGGGGGGGGVFDGVVPVVPGTTYTVTIATGGAGATSGAVASSNGTNTTFGSLVTAPGGQGGVSQNSSSGILPSANPGGSWGGPGQYISSATRGNASAGGGAGSSVIPAMTSTAGYVAATYNFFDGYGQRSMPMAIVPISGVVGSPNWQARSGDTWYPRIKRGNSAMQCPTGTWFAPGWAWKDLGAGGAPAYFAGGDHLEMDSFIHPTAGRINISSGTAGNATSYTTSNGRSGTDAKSNSGSGGGSAFSIGTGTSGAGGSGGSGYLEVTWQE